MSDTATFWRNHVAAWRRTELTQSAYCREHGLSRSQFCTWKRLFEAQQQPDAPRQVAVGDAAASASSASSSKPSFIEVTVAEAEDGQTEAIERAEDEGGTMAPGARKTAPEPSRAAGLRLELGDGLALALERDFDADALARAVEVLRDARR